MSLVVIVGLAVGMQNPPPRPSPARGEGDTEVYQSDSPLDFRQQFNSNGGTA
jgi:hypothetical protein